MGEGNSRRYLAHYFKLGAAAVFNVLLATSSALAESEYLNSTVPDNYLRLSQCVPCAEDESVSAPETSAAQAAAADSGQDSVK